MIKIIITALSLLFMTIILSGCILVQPQVKVFKLGNVIKTQKVLISKSQLTSLGEGVSSTNNKKTTLSNNDANKQVIAYMTVIKQGKETYTIYLSEKISPPTTLEFIVNGKTLSNITLYTE